VQGLTLDVSRHRLLLHRGDFIASGGAGGELRVWDLASREMVVHLKHHSLAITDLKVNATSMGWSSPAALCNLQRLCACGL
jgi:WD40 repeat protein